MKNKKLDQFICGICYQTRFSFIKNKVNKEEICDVCLSKMTVENLVAMYVPREENSTIIPKKLIKSNSFLSN